MERDVAVEPPPPREPLSARNGDGVAVHTVTGAAGRALHDPQQQLAPATAKINDPPAVGHRAGVDQGAGVLFGEGCVPGQKGVVGCGEDGVKFVVGHGG